MIAVNITRSMKGKLDDRDPADIRGLAEKWWVLTDENARRYADTLLAVARNIIVGVYAVDGWQRDPANNKLVFDLREEPEWQFLVGERPPAAATWSRGQSNPVSIIDSATAAELVRRRTSRIPALGWSLDVSADGHSATVRAPRDVAVVDLRDDVVYLNTLDRA